MVCRWSTFQLHESQMQSQEKLKLLALEGPRQTCYSSTLEEMDYNCVVTKYEYCYFENF